jgi:hypothetical protein
MYRQQESIERRVVLKALRCSETNTMALVCDACSLGRGMPGRVAALRNEAQGHPLSKQEILSYLQGEPQIVTTTDQVRDAAVTRIDPGDRYSTRFMTR